MLAGCDSSLTLHASRLLPAPSLWRRRVERTWHWFSITWGLYIMEPWEITIVLACLLGTLAAALHGLWMLAAWLRAAGGLCRP